MVLLVLRSLIKSHISSYIKKDGSFVAQHDDKRHAASLPVKKPQKGHSYRLFSGNAGNASSDPWTDEQWGKLRLDDGNSNAATHHKLLDKMRSMAAQGDVDGIKNMAHGMNTYGKKRALIAQHLVGAMVLAKPSKILVSPVLNASNLMHTAAIQTPMEKKMGITYTFPQNAKNPDLQGITATGGRVETRVIGGIATKVVVFDTKVNGKVIAAKLDGASAELIAAVAAFKSTEDQKKANAKLALEKAVPGLAELKSALNANEAYQHAFQKMMDNENNDGVNPPKAPVSDLDSLRAKYPLAALYVKAESFEQASNYMKSSAGTAAKKALVEGSSPAEVAEIMDDWLGEKAKAKKDFENHLKLQAVMTKENGWDVVQDMPKFFSPEFKALEAQGYAMYMLDTKTGQPFKNTLNGSVMAKPLFEVPAVAAQSDKDLAFLAEWTPEVTAQRQAKWKAASAKVKTYDQLQAVTKELGYNSVDINRAIKLNSQK